jgi:hypothetical protein
MNTQLLDLRTVNSINIRAMAQTTENALAEIRRTMRYYRSQQTIRRSGWYYTERKY